MHDTPFTYDVDVTVEFHIDAGSAREIATYISDETGLDVTTHGDTLTAEGTLTVSLQGRGSTAEIEEAVVDWMRDLCDEVDGEMAMTDLEVEAAA